MICEPCRDGGVFNAAAGQAVSERVASVMRAEAERSHRECEGGTHCDCQHKTGDGWINRQLVPA